MSEVIDFPKADKSERLFDDYVSKAKKAQESHDWRDGIEAGKAWSRFMQAFEVK